VPVLKTVLTEVFVVIINVCARKVYIMALPVTCYTVPTIVMVGASVMERRENVNVILDMLVMIVARFGVFQMIAAVTESVLVTLWENMLTVIVMLDGLVLLVLIVFALAIALTMGVVSMIIVIVNLSILAQNVKLRNVPIIVPSMENVLYILKLNTVVKLQLTKLKDWKVANVMMVGLELTAVKVLAGPLQTVPNMVSVSGLNQAHLIASAQSLGVVLLVMVSNVTTSVLITVYV